MIKTDQPATSQAANDDLDVLLILKRASAFFKTNGRRLSIALLIGLLCGLALNFIVPKNFTSRLLLETTVVNNTETKAIVQDWNQMLRPAGYSTLMKEFGCSERLVRNLKKITAEPLSQQTETGTALAIDVSVRDTAMMKDVQEALVRGFRQNDYVNRRVVQRREGTREQIDQVTREIAKLDSSKGVIGTMLGTERNGNTPVILDIANISVERTALVEKLTALREALLFMDAASVLQNFTAPQGPKPGLITLLAIGLAGGFIVGYLISLGKSLKAKISTL